MNRFILTATGLSMMITPLFAQGAITSPKGGLTIEGLHYAYYLGRYADGRYQFADGENKGKAHTITEVGYRLDNRSPTTSTAMGRSWSSVTLHVSDMTNFETMDRTWSKNISGTQTLVFSGKADWDSQTGTPLIKPDIWGGLKGKLRFPFSTPWVYTGKNDMLLDYNFQGGVLANASAWSGSSSRYYYMDGESISTYSKSGVTERLPAVRGTCNDSGITYTSPAYLNAYGTTYGANSSTITQRNKLYFYHYSYYTAPHAPVIHALGLGGHANGINIGAGCNKLYVDFSKPVVMIPFTTIKGSTSSASGTMGYLMPWNNALARKELWLQGAWADSQTGQLSLTEASHVTLPDGLPPAELPRRKAMYAYPSTAATGYTPTTSGYAQPFVQYKTK